MIISCLHVINVKQTKAKRNAWGDLHLQITSLVWSTFAYYERILIKTNISVKTNIEEA